MEDKMTNKSLAIISIMCVSISLFMYYFFIFDILNVNIFIYPDFQQYIWNDLFSANFAYGIVVRYLNFELSNPIYVILSITLHIYIVYFCTIYLRNYFTNISFIIFVAYFALNPFLTASAFLFDTILFVKIFVLVALMHEKNTISPRQFLYLSLLVSMFRFSILLLLIPYLISYKFWRSVGFRHIIVSILLACLIFLAQGDYLYRFGGSIDRYNWNEETELMFSILNFDWLSKIFVYISKILLLFGGREAMYTEGLKVFVGEEKYLQLILCSLLAIINLTGFVIFCCTKKFSINFKMSLVVLVIGSLLSVSHARYITPYMPVFAISIVLWLQKQLNNSRKKDENCHNSCL